MHARLASCLGILAILLVAAAIRLPPLPTKGVSFVDEGFQLQEGRFLASVAVAAMGTVGIAWPVGLDPDFATIDGLATPTRWGSLRGSPVLTGRPLHTTLLGLAMLLAGERPVAGQMVAALLGLATVAMVFAIARRLYGSASALVAAAALAVSGWHAIYSTQALAESDSLFVAAIALWLGLGTRPHRLLWTGLALGVAFLTNPRTWVLVPIILLVEALRRWPISLSNLGTYAGGVLLPLILADVVSRMGVLVGAPLIFGNYLLDRSGTIARWVSFLAGNAQAFRTPPPRAPLIDQISFYPFLTWAWDGPLLAGLLGLGLAGVVWRRRRAELPVLVIFLGAFVAQTFLTSIAARFFLLLALPAALLAGRSLLWVSPGRRGLCAGLLLAVLLLEGIPRSSGLASVSSGYREAAALIVRETGGKHLSNQSANTGFYTGLANARWLDDDLEKVRRDVAEGYYLAVVALRPGLAAAASWGDLPEARRLEPVAIIPNAYGASLQQRMEVIFIPLSDRIRDVSRVSGSIFVYDLRPLTTGMLP